MEAAQRQREVAAERARIEAERKAADNERIARETAANLERMRASWAESQALQQARSRPPCTSYAPWGSFACCLRLIGWRVGAK